MEPPLHRNNHRVEIKTCFLRLIIVIKLWFLFYKNPLYWDWFYKKMAAANQNCNFVINI
jgi:hypothetical protein